MNLPEGTPMSRLRRPSDRQSSQQDLRSDVPTATVDYDLVPFLGNKVDLHLNIDAGERIRVKQVSSRATPHLIQKICAAPSVALKFAV